MYMSDKKKNVRQAWKKKNILSVNFTNADKTTYARQGEIFFCAGKINYARNASDVNIATV